MKAMKWLLACVLLVPAAAAADEKAELKKLQGTWKATSVKYAGTAFPVEGDQALYMVIKGDVATVKGSEDVKKEYAKVKLKLDPSTTPKVVDVIVTSGTMKDKVMEGIYKLEGDKFTICVNVTGKDRPGKFESPESENIAIVELEREK
jgi:uncharacterized protein (TIGR03067 family)